MSEKNLFEFLDENLKLFGQSDDMQLEELLIPIDFFTDSQIIKEALFNSLRTVFKNDFIRIAQTRGTKIDEKAIEKN